MALQPNKTTGKAIADVKALYFLKHVGGVEPVILQSLDSPDWFPVLSLKGTVTASQDAPSLEKILVDQFDAPIGMTSEPGDFNFEAQLPSLAQADIANWLESPDLVVASGASIDGNQVIGFNLNGKSINVSVLIKTGTGASIIFSNAQVVLTFSKEDKVFLFRVSGQILAPENAQNHMIYIASEPVAVTGVTLNKSTTSLAVGASETLTATVAPAAASQNVTWSSSDPSKATVDNTGKVTAVATASGANAPKIRATSQVDSTQYAECTVTVTA